MLIYSKTISSYWINGEDTAFYSMKDENKFINYFYSFIKKEYLYNKNFKIYDIQDDPININKKYFIFSNKFFNNKKIKKNIKIILSVENCYFWTHYKHYNKYGNFNDELISIYLYNHINKFIKTDKYIAIPIIYLQIDYFNKFFNRIKPNIFTPFKKKKFCLVCSTIKNNYNNNLEIVLNKLKSIGECDYIQNISELKDKSCYHDQTLLNIYNQYKFIYCHENSITDGYITEKIFNCFFARTIPIYFGSSDKYRYFNNNSFIDIETFNDDTFNYVKSLNKNRKIYNNFLNNDIINKNFDNENYVKQSNDFIKNLV
jgi:hypothetical protein